jgi:hypothetical protein
VINSISIPYSICSIAQQHPFLTQLPNSTIPSYSCFISVGIIKNNQSVLMAPTILSVRFEQITHRFVVFEFA